jgi:hypothetical protein
MWGEVLNEKILTAAATSANQYIQGAGTLDNDTLAIGEPCLLLPPAAAWNDDDNYKWYLATNVHDATGASSGLAVGAYLMAGFAAVAIPEGYWAWAIMVGRSSTIRCYDTGVAAWEYLVLDTATATVDGMSVKNADADGQTAYGYALAADVGAAHTVDAYVDARGIGCMFDIA